MNDTKLKLYSEYDCHMLYDYIINNETIGQFEIQFDDNEFNGKIFYTELSSENEDGEFEWQELKDTMLYDLVKNKAIKDYNRQ